MPVPSSKERVTTSSSAGGAPTDPAIPGTAERHARRMLEDLGVAPHRFERLHAPHPAQDWADSGARWLTGWPAGPTLEPPGPAAAFARGALAVIEALAGPLPGQIDAPALLGERAALAGLTRGGRTTVGGAGQLLPTADGWLAVQLPRADDVAMLPAWLEMDRRFEGEDAFEAIAPLIRECRANDLVERAHWLGLPIAHLPAAHDQCDLAPPGWIEITCESRAPIRSSDSPISPDRLRVLDLSSLWAGPLCGHLLQQAGADVVKVEHPDRVDGARRGPEKFFDLLNGGKSCVALDLNSSTDRRRLHDLIAGADIVVESARPRGLEEHGFDADALVAAHPGLSWISITGYGRRAPQREWVAFGDDAAVAAGLVARAPDGSPVFCGDAIADPLTGLHAAAAALAAVQRGGGIYDVSLAGVARCVVDAPIGESRIRPPGPEGALDVPAPRCESEVRLPRARSVRHRAQATGADTLAVLRRWSSAPAQRAIESRRC